MILRVRCRREVQGFRFSARPVRGLPKGILPNNNNKLVPTTFGGTLILEIGLDQQTSRRYSPYTFRSIQFGRCTDLYSWACNTVSSLSGTTLMMMMMIHTPTPRLRAICGTATICTLSVRLFTVNYYFPDELGASSRPVLAYAWCSVLPPSWRATSKSLRCLCIVQYRA